MREFVYLASPYTHPEKLVMQERYEEICRLVAILIKQGYSVYSPIAHNHYIADQYNLPRDAEFWLSYDESFLFSCSFILIAGMPGWESSKGIAAERLLAIKFNKPIYLYNTVNYIISNVPSVVLKWGEIPE
jgi:hypothetical protein